MAIYRVDYQKFMAQVLTLVKRADSAVSNAQVEAFNKAQELGQVVVTVKVLELAQSEAFVMGLANEVANFIEESKLRMDQSIKQVFHTVAHHRVSRITVFHTVIRKVEEHKVNHLATFRQHKD